MQKAEMDEFGWILIGALIFIVIITVVWLPARQPSPVGYPNSVELNMVAGSVNSFFLTINGSDSGELTNVTLTPSGVIKDWVSFDKNVFDIDSGSESVRVNIAIPKTVVPGTYIGNIKISAPGGKTSVSIKINVIGIGSAKVKSRPILLYRVPSWLCTGYGVSFEPVPMRLKVM